MSQWRNGKWVEDSKTSDFEKAKSRVYYVKNYKKPGHNRLYQTCLDATCKGWEWCRNHASCCRKCQGPLSSPPPEWIGKGSSSAPSSVGERSTGSLADLLPEIAKFEGEFPGLTQKVQDSIPKPVQQPAAALHTAQQGCQVAFKQLQQAEAKVAYIEGQAAHLSTQLRQKVSDLQEASAQLLAAQKNHDIAAREAQLQVQKSKVVCSDGEEAEHLQKLVEKCSPEQLKKLASNLEEAAAAKTQSSSTKQEEQVVPINNADNVDGTLPPQGNEQTGVLGLCAQTVQPATSPAVFGEAEAAQAAATAQLEQPVDHMEIDPAKRAPSPAPSGDSKRSRKSDGSDSRRHERGRSRSPVGANAAEKYSKVSKQLDEELRQAVPTKKGN